MQTVACSKQTPVASMAAARPARATAFKSVNAAAMSRASFGRSLAAKGLKAGRVETSRQVVVAKSADGKTVVIGLAADSGCGKSTFMRR